MTPLILCFCICATNKGINFHTFQLAVGFLNIAPSLFRTVNGITYWRSIFRSRGDCDSSKGDFSNCAIPTGEHKCFNHVKLYWRCNLLIRFCWIILWKLCTRLIVFSIGRFSRLRFSWKFWCPKINTWVDVWWYSLKWLTQLIYPTVVTTSLLEAKIFHSRHIPKDIFERYQIISIKKQNVRLIFQGCYYFWETLLLKTKIF